MTSGLVVVLGRVGRNFGAGMTGGKAFVWDPGGVFPLALGDTAPPYRMPEENEVSELRAIVDQHVTLTRSPIASALVNDWSRSVEAFWLLAPGSPNGGAEAEPTINLDLNVRSSE